MESTNIKMISREEYDKVVEVVAKRDELITSINDGAAADRRRVTQLNAEIHALKNPPAPTFVITVELMQHVLNYLTSQPYAETFQLIDLIRQATEVEDE